MLNLKGFLLTAFLLGLAGTCASQNESSIGPWRFHSINNIGLLEGETGSSFQLQTINGAQWNSWFAGLGTGLDYYRYRSVPLFVDFRKEFGKSSNKPFVYTDFGIHFTWLTDQQKTDYDMSGSFHDGFYTDLGLGYKIGMKKHNALLLSLGYSMKKSTEYLYPLYTTYMDFPGIAPAGPDKLNFTLKRLSMKIGWEF